MAKVEDDTIDPPKKWIRQFDSFPLDEIIPKVYGLLLKSFTSSKNLERLKGIGKALTTIDLQPSPSTTSSSPDSNED